MHEKRGVFEISETQYRPTFECATRQTLRATAEQDVSAATSHVRRDLRRIADSPARTISFSSPRTADER